MSVNQGNETFYYCSLLQYFDWKINVYYKASQRQYEVNNPQN